jgi:LPXTG-site transpeptidase (sortase) family protein
MKKSAAFALTFVALFALTYAFMAMVDALPDPINSNGPSVELPIADASTAVAEMPVRIVAKAISLDKTVSNPDSTDVDVLNEALLKGAVRYPGSAELGVNGTVLIFGHSSYLPIVHNQNYKAFDGVQNLKAGDTVSVYSATREYRYSVTGVRLANATEDVVELPSNSKYLTLVTCDSFGTKSDRFVVTAEFAGMYSI